MSGAWAWFLKLEILPLAFLSFPYIQQKDSHVLWFLAELCGSRLSVFLEGHNFILDPVINLATLISKFLKFKGGLIKNYDLFANQIRSNL